MVLTGCTARQSKARESIKSQCYYGCETWTLHAGSEKRIQVFETKCLRKLLRICYLEHKTNDWVRSKSTSFNRNLFWQLSRDGNLHDSGMSHAMTALPKPSFRAPWRVGDVVVGRGYAGQTTSKGGHICPYQNCSQGPPAETTGRGSLLKRPSCSDDDPIGQGTELN